MIGQSILFDRVTLGVVIACDSNEKIELTQLI